MPWKTPVAGERAGVAGAAGLQAAPEHVLGALEDHVHVGLAGAHVGARHEPAAQRRDHVAVAVKQGAPFVSCGNLRHRQDRLAAAEPEIGDRELGGHACGEAHRVFETV